MVKQALSCFRPSTSPLDHVFGFSGFWVLLLFRPLQKTEPGCCHQPPETGLPRASVSQRRGSEVRVDSSGRRRSRELLASGAGTQVEAKDPSGARTSAGPKIPKAFFLIYTCIYIYIHVYIYIYIHIYIYIYTLRPPREIIIFLVLLQCLKVKNSTCLNGNYSADLKGNYSGMHIYI